MGTEETGALVPRPVPPRDLALGPADGRAVVGPVLSESEPREPRLRPGQKAGAGRVPSGFPPPGLG